MREHTPESFRDCLVIGECECECEQAYDNTKDLLQEAAYFNWLNAGCPSGRDVEFWCEAERQILGFTLDEYWDPIRQAEYERLDRIHFGD